MNTGRCQDASTDKYTEELVQQLESKFIVQASQQWAQMNKEGIMKKQIEDYTSSRLPWFTTQKKEKGWSIGNRLISKPISFKYLWHVYERKEKFEYDTYLYKPSLDSEYPREQDMED